MSLWKFITILVILAAVSPLSAQKKSKKVQDLQADIDRLQAQILLLQMDAESACRLEPSVTPDPDGKTHAILRCGSAAIDLGPVDTYEPDHSEPTLKKRDHES